MDTLFLVCAILGGAVLLFQFVLGTFGLDGQDLSDVELDTDTAEGFNLLSARAITAGVAFFGLGGLALLAAGLAAWAALPGAALVGLVAALAVAALMRSFLRLQSDATVRIEHAVGQPGTVYLKIPGERTGTGKVHLSLQGRTVECQAVTSRGELLTGTPVIVVDVLGPDTVEVAPAPNLGELLHVSR